MNNNDDMDYGVSDLMVAYLFLYFIFDIWADQNGAGMILFK